MVGLVNSISDFFLGKELESGSAAVIQLYHWHQVHQKLHMHCQILVGVKFSWKWQTKKEKAVVENIKDIFIVMFLGSIMWVKICMYFRNDFTLLFICTLASIHTLKSDKPVDWCVKSGYTDA